MQVRLRVLAAFLLFEIPCDGADKDAPAVSPQRAIELLRAGARRYCESALIHPRQTPEHRIRISGAQGPFGQALACSGSRISTEIVYDRRGGQVAWLDD